MLFKKTVFFKFVFVILIVLKWIELIWGLYFTALFMSQDLSQVSKTFRHQIHRIHLAGPALGSSFSSVLLFVIYLVGEVPPNGAAGSITHSVVLLQI